MTHARLLRLAIAGAIAPNVRNYAVPDLAQNRDQPVRALAVRGDQKASGDVGVFDLKSNTVALMSNVVVSRCQDVVRGDRLVVDLTTGVSQMGRKNTANCRQIQAIINSNSCNAGKPDPAFEASRGLGGNRL